VPESEDCLNLNIWLPPGAKKGMPVVVYFHGGMNQHGSGAEAFRQGDGLVQSAKYPTIFINFDFRMGIFGWISGAKGSNVTSNLGMLDQQAALRWVQRNIGFFGGDARRVTLQGQSEGAGILLAHLVAPGSRGLFDRVAFHSPPADMWSRHANEERTRFMAKKVGCQKKLPADTLACLRKVPAQTLWNADWLSEELSRNMGSSSWFRNVFQLLAFSSGKDFEAMPGYLGWHAVVDGTTLPGEPRELIARGEWSKVPVLVTVARNESLGVFPAGGSSTVSMRMALGTLLGRGGGEAAAGRYRESLERSGIRSASELDVLHQMVTDKMWTCDVRSLARDVAAAGGEAYVGMFWHSPKYDPVGIRTNKECTQGASCHAADMMYILPQGHGVGIQGDGMEEEAAFARRYRDEFLAFVHGRGHAWQPYNASSQVMTFNSAEGRWAVPGYRRPQCDVLDGYAGEMLPAFARQQASSFVALQQSLRKEA